MMFKKLRNQILFFNLLALTLLMAVVLVLIFVMVRESAKTENQTQLELSFSGQGQARQIALYEVEDLTADETVVSFSIIPINRFEAPVIKGKLVIEKWDEQGYTIDIKDGGIRSDTLGALFLFRYSDSFLIEIIRQVSPGGGRAFVYFEEGAVPDIAKEIDVSTGTISFEGMTVTVPVNPEINGARTKENLLLTFYSILGHYFGPYFAYPYDAYQEAAERFIHSESSQGSFMLNGQSWLYRGRIGPTNPTDLGISTYDFNNLSREELIARVGTFDITLLNVSAQQKSLNNLLLILILCGMAMSCVFFVISFQVAKRVVRPVEASWVRQKQFMSDASHELKTPLSVISVNHEVLQKNHAQIDESQLKWLNSIEAETGRMNKLVTALLTLSKGDESPAVLSTVNLSQLVKEICTGFEAVAYEKDVELTAAIEPDLMISAEADTLEPALIALFDNAVKYTPAGQQIRATLIKDGKHVVFTLRNTGVGIAKEDLNRIFDRFYRVDKARTQETGGTTHHDWEPDDQAGAQELCSAQTRTQEVGGFGLGLSIAQNAVQRSGGTIEASSDADSVTITVRLKSA